MVKNKKKFVIIMSIVSILFNCNCYGNKSCEFK